MTMFEEEKNERSEAVDAQIVGENTPGAQYTWHSDDYQQRTVYGTARPVYKEVQVAPEKKKRGFFGYAATSIAGMLVGAMIFAGASTYTQYRIGSAAAPAQAQQSPSPTGAKPVVASGDALSVADIAKKAGPSVVGVVSTVKSQSFFGAMQEQEGGGSGIIIKEDGYIITNQHVIEGASTVKVVLSSGKEYDAKLVGKDAKTDLAVIKIEETGLPVAELGRSSALEVGELAVAIGNPLGQEFAGSVTAGVISALNRAMNVEGRQYTLIQTDAAINPGNSGGALVNKYGQIIGINTVKIGASGYEGMGFAIPIDIAAPIIDELLSNGYIKGRPVIGIGPRTITAADSKRYNLPVGVYVLSVAEFSGAEKAGIRVADIITKADGKEVTTVDDLNKIRDTHKAGEQMELTIVREEKVITVTVTLGEEQPE